jgi:hypothetical protein
MRASRSFRSAALAAVVVVLATALGASCGKNRVLLDVDVRSFMNEGDLVNPYEAPPGLPFSTRLDSIPVNLVEGFQDFGTAESATLDIALAYDNTSGQGHGRFLLRFAADPASLWSTPAVAALDVDLVPGVVSTSQARIQADQRLLDLFTSKRFWMGVDLEWQPAGLDPLRGTATITQIHAHLVSTLDFFE